MLAGAERAQQDMSEPGSENDDMAVVTESCKPILVGVGMAGCREDSPWAVM